MEFNRNTQALKRLALLGAVLAYAGAVVYGDIMFLQTIEIAFPKSGIFASLAIAGALVTALSALVLPVALHWWFAPGGQFIGGLIFWAADIVALALNSMLAFQSAAGVGLDPFIETWRSWSPATPMLAVIGWGMMFLLDQSHKKRHAQAELEADQIDIYTQRLRTAAKSAEVNDVLIDAAKRAAWDYAQRLNGASVSTIPQITKSLNGHKSETIVLNSDGDQAAKVDILKANRGPDGHDYGPTFAQLQEMARIFPNSMAAFELKMMAERGETMTEADRYLHSKKPDGEKPKSGRKR